jgi:uncharacterized protein
MPVSVREDGGGWIVRGSRYARQSLKPNPDALFKQANEEWDRRKLRSAFRLFLSGARAGDPGAQVNLGYFYDTGVGMKPNRRQALYWYKKAFEQGYAAAATNIGTILRDQRQFKKALVWFRRAVKLGDGDANLEIAKIYLRDQGEGGRAIPYLRRTIRARVAAVTDGSRREAKRLLEQCKKK